jgi:hypothetical protein
VPPAALPHAVVPTAQSATVPELLDAVTDRLKYYGRTDRVVEWDATLAERPPVEAADFFSITFVQIVPQPASGAGRWGWPARGVMSVGVWTRFDVDVTGNHRAWNRRHWPSVFTAVNALAAVPLYAAYDTGSLGGTGDPTGRLLTTGGLDLVPGIDLNKVTARQGYGYTEVRFSCPFVLALDPRHVPPYRAP